MRRGFCPAFAATPEIGDTVAVKNEVTAEVGEDSRKLAKGAKVFQNEILVTSETASAEIQLLDKTKLAVGSSARIVLDKFIYDPSAAPGSISINLAKGAFRFITGKSPKTAYEIKTPTASMGVRGTVFDVFVADNGETVVLLHEGGVDVCPYADVLPAPRQGGAFPQGRARRRAVGAAQVGRVDPRRHRRRHGRSRSWARAGDRSGPPSHAYDVAEWRRCRRPRSKGPGTRAQGHRAHHPQAAPAVLESGPRPGSFHFFGSDRSCSLPAQRAGLANDFLCRYEALA